MTILHKRVLRFGLILLCVTIASIAWSSWPLRTATFIASSIENQQFDAIREVLDETAVDDLRSHVKELRGRKFCVSVTADRRSFLNQVLGTQGFLMMGYNGAHRFNVTRGRISNFRYVFISGKFEYGTTR